MPRPNDLPRVAIAGLGGFAAEHHAALMHLEREGRCRVVATCDPSPEVAATGRERFELDARSIPVHPDLATLLQKHEVDLLTLPTPIPLHAEGHRMAVDAGAACYLEKPPTLWWPEYREMLDVERRAAKATQIGFNFVGDPFRRNLKARILKGEFGKLREVRLRAVWPRDEAYYARNDWAGKIKANGKWVLDSPIGNATAHYVQNLLFWAGESLDTVAPVFEVRAWLARTRPIESYDTVLAEATLGGGVNLRLAVTHAPLGPTEDRETLIFDRATVTLPRWNEARIEKADGTVETLVSEIPDQRALLRHNFAETLVYVEGERPHPITPLGMAASFVALCDLALLSAGEILNADVPDLTAFVENGHWPDAVPTPVNAKHLPQLTSVANRILGLQNPPEA